MFGADIGSVVSGLINSGRGLPTIDVGALMALVDQNKTQNTDLINKLPESLRPLYAQYTDTLGQAGTNLGAAREGIGSRLLEDTRSLYGPESEAVKATLAGLRQADYSTLPGTIDALRANLAATGGLARGGAANAITQATLAPAAQFSQQAANVMGQQLQTQQTNVQQALNTIANLDDNTAQAIFGMTKDQASNILQFGRQDLQNQLADLINTNNTATNAKLGIQGIAANNAYQNAVTRNAQKEAITNGLVNLGVNGVTSMFSGGAGGAGAGLPAGADVGSASYFQNALANSPLR